tara:strand:- start:1938 stop:2339 length:402 start_codon:yes stop_codon:yes gene_type:complete
MAHFAKLGVGNIVLEVHVVSNDIATTEQEGVEFLQNLYKSRDVWKKTSYNTRGGVHRLGGTPFRKNFAGVGYKYDSNRDAFIAKKPYESWTLNEDSCIWQPPVPEPELTDEQIENRDFYVWNETNQTWILNKR